MDIFEDNSNRDHMDKKKSGENISSEKEGKKNKHISKTNPFAQDR